MNKRIIASLALFLVSLGVIVLLQPKKNSQRVKKTITKQRMSCFADTSVPFRVRLPPTKASSIPPFIKSMESYSKSTLSRWLQRIQKRRFVSAKQYSRLKQLKVKVSRSLNSLGSVQGNNITIDIGFFFVGYAFAFATSKLQAGMVSMRQYNTWHDYFLDSIMQGDRIMHVTGGKDFGNFIHTMGYIDPKSSRHFYANLNSWLALTMLHEVSHYLLQHADKWGQTFSGLSYGDPSQWRNEHYKFSRSMEYEADQKAIDLYMKGMGFNPTGALSSWATWLLVRNEAIRRNKNAIFYPTHPDPIKRISRMLGHIMKVAQTPPKNRASLRQMTVSFVQKLRNRIRKGPLRKIPVLRGNKPKYYSRSIERWLLRETQLRIYNDMKKSKRTKPKPTSQP